MNSNDRHPIAAEHDARMEAERQRHQREESLLTSFQAERASLTQQMEAVTVVTRVGKAG